MISEKILNSSLCIPIRHKFSNWYRFMEQNVEFGLPNSEIHTYLHCARVLLLALVIGNQLGLKPKELDVLAMAAIFHDSRRQDDWLDTGHGQRAAEYYASFCQDHTLSYDHRAYMIMAFHDLNDIFGLAEITKMIDTSSNTTLLYQIFKDADGLDRLRLGPGALDVNMLRTKEAKSLVFFAEELLQSTERISSLHSMRLVYDK